MVHIPLAASNRLGALLADCMEGAMEGEQAWSDAWQAFAPLLLGAVGKGKTPTIEIEQRLAYWEGRDWESLITRAELSSPRPK